MKELAIRTAPRNGWINPATKRIAGEVPASLREGHSATFTPPPRRFDLDFQAFPVREA